LLRRIAGQKIEFEGVFGHFARVGVETGEPIVIVVHIEAVVLGNDDAAGEDVHAKPLILPSDFCRIEDAANIVPGKRADQPFFPVAEFLAANLE